jgi:hypothetical protein
LQLFISDFLFGNSYSFQPVQLWISRESTTFILLLQIKDSLHSLQLNSHCDALEKDKSKKLPQK